MVSISALRCHSPARVIRVQPHHALYHGLVLLVACLLLMPSHAHAQATPPIMNSFTSLDKATDLKAQPLSLLAKFPDAGVAMARFVARAVARNPSVADAILSVISASSPEQASAIGAGMVRAVRVLEARGARAARRVAANVMRNGNVWLKHTFIAVGPAYAANAPLILPDPLPPVPLSTTPIGTPAPPRLSELGPDNLQQSSVLPAQNPAFSQRTNFNAETNLLSQGGTLVASITAIDAIVADGLTSDGAGPITSVVTVTPPPPVSP